MPASYRIILRKNKINRKGEHPLYLRITENRKSSFKALGTYVSPELWDEAKQKVKAKYPNSVRVNNMLAQELATVQSKALELKAANANTSANDIKQALTRRISNSFSDYLEAYLQKLKREERIGTFRRVMSIGDKFKAYNRNREMLFTDIDVPFLKTYERYLRDELNNSVNTIHSNLKVFRMLFNLAYQEGIITADQNPFLRFKLQLGKTNKDFITEDELQKLEAFPLKETIMMNHHRWMYVFACYAGGLRISDILQLRWTHFNGTHITFKIHKTQEPISIRLPNRALAILEKYRPLTAQRSDNFIFPIFDSALDYSDKLTLFRAISSATAYANKNLKILAEKVGIDKHISFHTSRHTFATLALRKGVRMEYVSKLMGHSSLKTTQIYAKIVNEELDRAMEAFN